MLTPLFHILLIFVFLLIFNYFLPVWVIFRILYKSSSFDFSHRKIQKREARKAAIKREIYWSVISIFINAVMAYIAIRLALAGYSKIYLELDQYGWFYLLISPLICLLMHDTYFYWMHRIMHHKRVFKYIHVTHHLSRTPTPWAIFCFGPIDNFFNSLLPIGIMFLIPLHPLALAFYFLFNFTFNLIGHLGYELTPRTWLKGGHFMSNFNSSTHHDHHHSHPTSNFSLYFNFWDRIMHTNHKDFIPKTTNKKPEHATDYIST